MSVYFAKTFYKLDLSYPPTCLFHQLIDQSLYKFQSGVSVHVRIK